MEISPKFFHWAFLHILSYVIFMTEVNSENLLYELHIKYISGAPDGVFKSKILSCNGLFPCPTIYATVGDNLTVMVHNEIQDGQNTTIHWHGIHMQGESELFEDGTNYVSQCPLKVGNRQKYSFHLKQSGTYWYHSHTGSQYTEGLWGALIVRNIAEVYEYDQEIVITLNDWYHRTAKENEHWHLSIPARGVPPYPDSGMINGRGRYSCEIANKRNFNCSADTQHRHIFHVEQNKRIRFRVINTAAYSAFRFSIDNHKLETIEVDGVDTVPVMVDEAILAVGQRYSFIVHTNQSLERYLIRANLMKEVLMLIVNENINPYPEALIPNITAVLEYIAPDAKTKGKKLFTTEHHDYNATITQKQLENPVLLDENLLSPYDQNYAPAYFDAEFILSVTFGEDKNGLRRGSFNNSPFHFHDIPLVLDLVNGRPIPESTFPLYVNHMDVVQIVINNDFLGPHPFHLHGHSMHVLGTGKINEGDYNPLKHDLVLNGAKRDTVLVQEKSWAVVRFVADNPGVWTFHCHIDWHNLSGMGAVIVTGMDIFQNHSITIPAETARLCQLQGINID